MHSAAEFTRRDAARSHSTGERAPNAYPILLSPLQAGRHTLRIVVGKASGFEAF